MTEQKDKSNLIHYYHQKEEVKNSSNPEIVLKE